MGTAIVKWGINLLGTTFLKRLAKSIVKVVVKRTDNTWDDEILEAMEKSGKKDE